MDDVGISPADISEVVAGVAFPDPYRRLESNAPEVLEWERALDREARAALHGTPTFKWITQRLAEQLPVGARPPIRTGRLWVQVHEEVQGGDVLSVSERLGGGWRRLTDASELAFGPYPAFDWVVPAPDGTRVAVGVSTRGDEESELRVIDLRTGMPLGPRVPHVAAGAVGWSIDGCLCCLAGSASIHRGADLGLVILEDAGAATHFALPPSRVAGRCALQVESSGRHLGLVATPTSPRLTHVFDRRDASWLVVDAPDDGNTFAGAFDGGYYYAVTTLDAPRGRLVKVPVESLDRRDAWVELIRESDDEVLRALAVVGGRMLLCYYVEGTARLRFAGLDGQMLEEMELPKDSVVAPTARSTGQHGAAPPVLVDEEGITFCCESMQEPPRLLRYGISSRRLHTLRDWPDGAVSTEVTTLRCASPDGYEVRYDVLGREDALDTERPGVVVSYGGWNAMPSVPGHLRPFGPFVEAGGVVIFAHPRGDGTMGAEQWRAGRREHKQRTFDDVLAVSRDAVDRGIVARRRLGLWGTSSGGLTVGAAITQQPDLYRAVVAIVPLLDMGRFVRDRFGEPLVSEYGDPYDADAASWLRRYSPYHNVVPGTRYPAALFVVAADDARVRPWHSRKMVARLQAASASDDPVLLRVHAGYGHLTVGDAAPGWLTAEWLGFLMDQLGLERPSYGTSESER